MSSKEFQFSYNIYDSIIDLNQEQKELLHKALEAKEKAYAPYSQFKVGAAILLENGHVVTGNNQENAAYPSGLCAERVALFAAKSQFPDEKVLCIAITTSANNPKWPVSPCGSCRQVISEYENLQKSPIQIIFQGEGNSIIELKSANNLLPFCFNNDLLKS